MFAIFRAAKLSLLNLLSLFRDHRSRRDTVGGGVVAELFRLLRKPTTFGGGGGVVAGIFRSLQKRNQMFTPH